LLSKKKFVTRDNLGKRRHARLLCVENESVNHLFFGCVVARKAWEEISLAEGFDIDRDIESIARC
jgi:hypothetical protein